ncbi:MAG TPA: hypothetical protein ENN80_09460, partial [Candidatus Hydrogenedentes bacterium]|nr:hypothetical protein [Candidatus Hydrogenedentota bacterium]
KEKEKPREGDIDDDEAMAALRGEIKKRRQTVEICRQHGKEAEAAAAESEILVLEEFLPKPLSSEELEAKVRAYVAEHPDVTHPGKLTGLLKKELGELVDGKALNDMCKQVLEG